MPASKQQFASVDDYIASFPADVQPRLVELRQTIHAAAPDAEETISYHMPTYILHGRLVYFAAWKKHIALYAAGSAAAAYPEELAPYLQAKGTLQFPLSQPLQLISSGVWWPIGCRKIRRTSRNRDCGHNRLCPYPMEYVVGARPAVPAASLNQSLRTPDAAAAWPRYAPAAQSR